MDTKKNEGFKCPRHSSSECLSPDIAGEWCDAYDEEGKPYFCKMENRDGQ